MGNCCEGDGINPHGPKRGEGGAGDTYRPAEDDIPTTLNTEEASEIARLSRAESVSQLTNEPSNLMMSLRRKFIITRAALQHGINDDTEQFNGEIQESISDMRDKDRRRVREWLESVQRALRGRKPTEFPPVQRKYLQQQQVAAASAAKSASSAASNNNSTSSVLSSPGGNSGLIPVTGTGKPQREAHHFKPSAASASASETASTNASDDVDVWNHSTPDNSIPKSSPENSNILRSTGSSASDAELRPMSPFTPSDGWKLASPGSDKSPASKGRAATTTGRGSMGSNRAIADGDDQDVPHVPLDRRASLVANELLGKRRGQSSSPPPSATSQVVN